MCIRHRPLEARGRVAAPRDSDHPRAPRTFRGSGYHPTRARTSQRIAHYCGCGCYDSLTERRPYRKRCRHSDARDVIVKGS